jgi:transposase
VSRPKRQQRTDAQERLKQEVARLRRELAERERQIADQAKQIAEKEKQIADLERQLALRAQNSTTTSKPPSSDGLAGRQRMRGRRIKSRRRRGGQHGHPGHQRALVPPERVNAVVELVPTACDHCERALNARHIVGPAHPHQVTELPSIEAHVTEYRCYASACPGCGRTTRARLPQDVVGQFGPHLTGVIAYLTVVCRLPRSLVRQLLQGVLQIPISVGSTQKAWEEASAAVAAPYAELQDALPHEAVLNADETGHRTNGEKRWLWTFVAQTFVFYTIASSRGSDVLCRLLGMAFAGILGSDRLPSYLKYDAAQRQFCWSHFRRNLLSALELARSTPARRFCRDALRLQRRLFRLWHRYRGDPWARGAPLTRAELIERVLPLEKKFFALAERHVNAADDNVRNLARALFEHHRHFFMFVYHEGVTPTNNSAERSIRPAVVWRKLYFGTRSEDGEIAVARLLTITRTCQLQQLNVLVYLTAAIAAHRRRQRVASLLPNPNP